MSRRSARLVSGGYFPDEDSDSSSITNMKRETPVKVVKRMYAGCKSQRAPTSSQAAGYVGCTGTESAVTTDQSGDAAIQSSQDLHITRTRPYAVTPRPPIQPLSKRVVESSGYSSSERMWCSVSYGQQPLSQRGVESSEDPGRRGAANAITTTTNVSECKSSSPSSSRKSERERERLLLANVSFDKTGMRKVLCILLFLVIFLFGFWFLSLLLTSVMKTPTPTVSNSPPVLSDCPCPPSSPLKATPPAPVVDPATVYAVVEEKMESLLMEQRLQASERLQVEQRLQTAQRVLTDMQSERAKMVAVDSDSRARLEREVAGLTRRLADYHADLQSAVTSLSDRVQAAEGLNVNLTQELSSLQMRPPPVPCPDPSTAPDYNQLTPELQQAMEKWFADRVKDQDQGMNRLSGKECSSDCGRPMADRMADFSLESQGASVVSTRCSETYRIRSACMTLFGFHLWYLSESPRTVIQGYPVLLPGKCWAFHGVQGTLLISLSHPVWITHVTLDHLPRSNSPTGRIDSAPKDFQVYGMINDTEEGTLLGNFTYDQDGESTQTFEIPKSSSDVAYHLTELRVLSNWGQMEYTCVYRFRVHGTMAST